MNLMDQTINVCEGVFQDSNAGSNGNNYLNNEDYIITICPESSGQNIELDFTLLVHSLMLIY